MLFMAISTIIAMVSNLRDFWSQWDEGGSVLFVVGLVLLVLAFWLMGEGIAAFLRFRGKKPIDSMSVLYR